MNARGWDGIDILLVTGDAYVDHPAFGTALIGRFLESLGYRVGIAAQPSSPEDVLKLGRPGLFAGVSSGAMDSMVNHYTSLLRLRSNDAYSPGGRPGARPDRAVLKYVNMVKRSMPGLPVVIGGIEASLRRVSHYDHWSGKLRKSILLDSKADILVYGMGERAVGEISRRLKADEALTGIPGTAVWASMKKLPEILPRDARELPSHEEILEEPAGLIRLTSEVEEENNPWCGRPLLQRADSRAVVVYPPAEPLSTDEMDRIYDLDFRRMPHPSYGESIPAHDMIANSITAVRGCSGGCSFCALGLHQGRFLTSRSKASVLREVKLITGLDSFGGTISDIGGPTANLYGLGCRNAGAAAVCRRVSCLFPEICSNFILDHGEYVELLKAAMQVRGVNHVFISSGIRYDVALRDPAFIKALVRHHVSGKLKVAPEHLDPQVLELMRKPPPELWYRFMEVFRKESAACGREQYIEPYLMVAFPGCRMEHMQRTAGELNRSGMRPEKAQIFLPTPMTMATAMYYADRDSRGDPLYVVKKPSKKKTQLQALPGHRPRR